MADDEAAKAGGKPVCAIEQEGGDGRVLLRGRVTGTAERTASYRLRVRKIGPAGSSDISQGGTVRVEPGRAAQAGQVGLSLEGGSRFEADLILLVDGEEIACRATGPAPAQP